MNSITKMQVCVTGAGGFVGHRLVEKLLQQGFAVRVLSRSKKRLFPDGVEVVLGDLCSTTFDFHSFISNCSVIFHCAGETKDLSSMRSLHVNGMRHLLMAVSDEVELTNRHIHWVQLSSVGVYGSPLGNYSDVRHVNEKSNINPQGEYEITKAEADELLISATARSENFTFSVLRPSNIVGLRMTNRSFARLIGSIVKGQFFYIGSNDSVSNYIHVDDVVDALIQCVKPEAFNNVFNLSNDCNLSEIVLSLSKYAGISSERKIVPEFIIRSVVKCIPNFFNLCLNANRINVLVSRTYYSNSKISSLLRFVPKHSIPDFSVEYLKKIL